MKAENISMAIGFIDDDIIEATDALRNQKVRRTHWQRWTALAACLCLVIGAATIFLRGFPIIGAKCGGNPGVLVGGSYYYATDFAFYRYIPETQEREYLMSKLFVRDVGWRADEYGLYYIKGLSLYVREHETGNTLKLYTADEETTTHIYFVDGSPQRPLANNRIDIALGNTRNSIYPLVRIAQIDNRTGEILWLGEISLEERDALQNSGNIRYEYPVGNNVFRKVPVERTTDGSIFYELQRDGQIFIARPEDENMWIDFMFMGDNLLIKCQTFTNPETGNARVDSRYAEVEAVNLLAKPDGNVVVLPFGFYIAGTDNHLIFVGNADTIDTLSSQEPPLLYSYDVRIGETELLYDGSDIEISTAEEVTTDGSWLFTTVPWSGTDCWKLVYNTDGKLIGLELWEADI